MNKYQEFCQAMEKENIATRKPCEFLITACQIYYSAYYQYEELIKIDNWYTQVYTHTEEGRKLKKGRISVTDKQILSFLVEYQRFMDKIENKEDKEEIEKLTKELKDPEKTYLEKETLKEDIERIKKRIVGRKDSLERYMYYIILPQERKKLINDFPNEEKRINNAAKRYFKVLKDRVNKSGTPEKNKFTDYLKMCKISDVNSDNFEKYVSIYQNNKKRRKISKEESFNNVLSEEYVNIIIKRMPIDKMRIFFGIIPITSKLTRQEMKSSNFDVYFEKKFRLSLNDMEKEIEKMLNKYAPIMEAYIKNKQILDQKKRSMMI